MEKKHTKKDLEAAIEKMHIGGSIQFVECFHNFLDLALSYFCNNMNERQMALRKRVEENEDFRKAYQETMEAYGDCAEDYKDPMGDMFMKKISHGQHGQFFTPEDLCELSANIVLGNDFYDGMTINDPTSGSGRMLLKALQIAREVHGKEPIQRHLDDLRQDVPLELPRQLGRRRGHLRRRFETRLGELHFLQD